MKLSFILCDPVVSLAEMAERMRRLKQLGYQGVELTATWPPAFSAAEFSDLSRHERMPVVSLLSGWSYAHEKLCLSSPDTEIRRRATDRLGTYIEYAAPLGALLVVGLMQGLRCDEPDDQVAAARIRECLRSAAELATARGVRLVLEPVNHLQVGFHHTAAEAAALVAQVASPALGYMLDTIHMHIEERSIEQTIREHGNKIRHFHLCESNGGMFGSGSIDFPGIISALRESEYKDFVSVKVYRDADWETAARCAAERILPLIAR